MFPDLTHRSLELERLDTGDYTKAEYALWQREMYYINRFLGDTRCLRLAIKELLNSSASLPLSILDVGAGSGELLAATSELIGVRNAFFVGAELNPTAANTIAERKNIFAVQAEALELPFADSSFDIVVCSLFLHHLRDEAAVRLLKEMNRVARRKFVVIDLNRHQAAHFLYRAFGRLVLQRFSLDDGSLSIRRSFRPSELSDLAIRAGLSNSIVRRRAMFRLVLSGSKNGI